MRIFLIPGTDDCSNMGDVAMLQAGYSRLRMLWPHASFQILTRAPDRLAIHCPGAAAISWGEAGRWLEVQALRRWFSPEGIPVGLPRPGLSLRGMTRVFRASQRRRAANFARCVAEADLVVLCGCGIMTDAFRTPVLQIFQIFAAAMAREIPCVMLGQGIGPLEDKELLWAAARVLPRVKAVFLREGRASLPLLERLGVPRENILFTGDDALELAFQERAEAPGNDIGINLRVADYSGMAGHVESLRAALAHVAATRRARFAGIPIKCGGEDSDVATLRRLMAGLPGSADCGEPPATPADVIRCASRNRVVIVGSYHAAVFALAQGIPAVGLVRSRNYRDKFRGLAEQFAGGCVLVRADGGNLAGQLAAAVGHLWDSAEELRPKLLSIAENQIRAARAVYETLPARLSVFLRANHARVSESASFVPALRAPLYVETVPTVE